MRVVSALLAFALGAFLGACGGTTDESTPAPPTGTDPAPADAVPTEGKGEVAGKVDGKEFAVMDARIFAGTISERKQEQGFRIVLSAQSNFCATPETLNPGQRTISFDIGAPVGEPVGVRTYVVPEPLAANADSVTARLDARTPTCGTKAFIATDGTVTIAEATATRVRGTFDLMMGRERIQGTFDAPSCAGNTAPPSATHCE